MDIHISVVDHSPSSSEAALERARTRGDIDNRWRADAGEWRPTRWLGDGVPDSVAAARIPGVYANLWVILGSQLSL